MSRDAISVVMPARNASLTIADAIKLLSKEDIILISEKLLSMVVLTKFKEALFQKWF